MNKLLTHLLATITIAVISTAAGAGSLETLEDFIKSTHSGKAAFTQVVTSPAQADQTVKTKTSSGRFEFLRPNRFKFIYTKPFEQSIVADGKTLWVYDQDLNQVTSRNLGKALAGAPATIVTASSDIKALGADFTLKEQPERAGLHWVFATPKVKDSQLQSVNVGLRAGNRSTGKAPELAVLEIVDSFGQRSVMTFTQFESNPALGAENFSFRTPAGASVTPQ